MIIQLRPFRVMRGTVDEQRSDAASLALTLRTMEESRRRSERSRKGWRTRRGVNDRLHDQGRRDSK